MTGSLVRVMSVHDRLPATEHQRTVKPHPDKSARRWWKTRKFRLNTKLCSREHLHQKTKKKASYWNCFISAFFVLVNWTHSYQKRLEKTSLLKVERVFLEENVQDRITEW